MGIGIAPIRVVTHFESPTMPLKPEEVEVLKNMATELELIVLLRPYETQATQTKNFTVVPLPIFP